MAKKPVKPPRAKPKPKPITVPTPQLPGDYKRGSTRVGEDYTAWETASGKKPDFGKKKGPGDPHTEITRKMKARPKVIDPGKVGPEQGYGRLPRGRAIPIKVTPPGMKKTDLRLNAMKRRLGTL